MRQRRRTIGCIADCIRDNAARSPIANGVGGSAIISVPASFGCFASSTPHSMLRCTMQPSRRFSQLVLIRSSSVASPAIRSPSPPMASIPARCRSRRCGRFRTSSRGGPVAITHAGDGTNRLFIVSEYGQILVIPNDQSVSETKTFLDIEHKVDYEDKENEEGLLGLAFHPKYKENGEFFVHYTAKSPPHTTVISRFKVSKDPERGRPEVRGSAADVHAPVLEPQGRQPGCSAPTAISTSALGDGGSANDPHGNGQNLEHAARQDPADRHRSQRATASPTRFPRTIRSSAAATPGRRSMPSACATSGACRSIRRRSCSGPPTSARTSGKKSTSSKRAATTAGAFARAFTSSTSPSPRSRPRPAPAARPTCRTSPTRTTART